MKVYADTSFLVKLLTHESGAEEAMAEYRRLDFPRLNFLPIHNLEVLNAIRQRAFHQKRAASGRERAAIGRERDAALGRVERWKSRGWFMESASDFDEAVKRARHLSEKQTEKLGCRSFDLLHVAFALELECDTFLTFDDLQAKVAHAEGFAVFGVT